MTSITVQTPITSPRGVRFHAFRALWIFIAGTATLLMLAGLPYAFRSMITPCADECAWGQLLPSNYALLEQSGMPVPVYAGIKLGITVLVMTVYLATGAVIFWKRPADRGAWYTSLVLVLLGTFGMGASEAVTFIPVIGETAYTIFVLMVAYAMELLFFLFPDGRFVPRWTRFVPLIWVGQWVALYITMKWVPLDSPLNANNWGWLVAMLFQAIPLLIGFWAQIYRYRRVSDEVQKLQTKWVVIGLLIMVVLELALWPAELFFAGEAHPGGLYDILATAIPMVVMLSLTTTMSIAMLRHRLWDIDLLINRALVYTVLTAILAAVYLGSVAGLQALFRRATGQEHPVAVMASTLGIAFLFTPLRRQIQHGVDRAFYRQPYDLNRVVAAFGAAVRDQVELNVLTGNLSAAIEQTLVPEHLSLWLNPSVRELTEGQPALPIALIDIAPGDPLLSAALNHSTEAGSASSIIDMEALHLQSPAARALREAGTDRIMVLVNQGVLLGLLMIGPRLSGQYYSRTDIALLDALARIAAPALRVAELVYRQQIEIRKREQFEQELRIARTVQKTLIPRELPQLPGWQLATYWQPARQIGGDFYDFMPLDDGRMVIVIGDVTGKGAPAALVMATCRMLLREGARRNFSPAEALVHANDLLQPEVPPGMFVTCQYVILDPATGEFVFANAGHNLPVLARPGSAIELKATGMPLGLLPGRTYDEVSATLSLGDHLILHSDGLVEAHNPDREMYGEGRMSALLAAIRAGMGSIEVIGALLDDLINFTGIAWEQEDDVTFIALKRTGDDTLSIQRHTVSDMPLSELLGGK